MLERFGKRIPTSEEVLNQITQYEIRLSEAHVIEASYFDRNINDWIEALTQQAGLLNERHRSKQVVEKEIQIYSHLRDTYSASTLREAVESLAFREVYSKTVAQWVNEDKVKPSVLSLSTIGFAINIGYPEFNKDLHPRKIKRLLHRRSA